MAKRSEDVAQIKPGNLDELETRRGIETAMLTTRERADRHLVSRPMATPETAPRERISGS